MPIVVAGVGYAPQITLQVDPSSLTDFQLDVSTLDGTAPLGVNTNWTSLPLADVDSISIRRGRRRPDQPNDAGTMVVTLDNLSGNYDPSNGSATNPYSANGLSWWQAGLPVRCMATWSGTTYPLFYGRLEDPGADLGMMPMATFTFVDGISDTSAAFVTFAALAETTAQRANRALDLIGWPASTRTILGSRPLVASGSTNSATSVIEECAKAEGGRFYVDASGYARLTTQADALNRTVKLVLADDATSGAADYAQLRTSPGIKQLVNESTVTANGYVATVTNIASIAKAKIRRSQNVTVPLSATSDADALATYLSTRFASTSMRVDYVEVEGFGLSAAWPNLLGIDLADRLQVKRTGVNGIGLNVVLTAEGIEHTISVDQWRIGFYTAPPDVTAGSFILDTSQLDSAAQLA